MIRDGVSVNPVPLPVALPFFPIEAPPHEEEGAVSEPVTSGVLLMVLLCRPAPGASTLSQREPLIESAAGGALGRKLVRQVHPSLPQWVRCRTATVPAQNALKCKSPRHRNFVL